MDALRIAPRILADRLGLTPAEDRIAVARRPGLELQGSGHVATQPLCLWTFSLEGGDPS